VAMASSISPHATRGARIVQRRTSRIVHLSSRTQFIVLRRQVVRSPPPGLPGRASARRGGIIGGRAAASALRPAPPTERPAR
jgi:hypothetical protein